MDVSTKPAVHKRFMSHERFCYAVKNPCWLRDVILEESPIGGFVTFSQDNGKTTMNSIPSFPSWIWEYLFPLPDHQERQPHPICVRVASRFKPKEISDFVAWLRECLVESKFILQLAPFSPASRDEMKSSDTDMNTRCEVGTWFNCPFWYNCTLLLQSNEVVSERALQNKAMHAQATFKKSHAFTKLYEPQFKLPAIPADLAGSSVIRIANKAVANPRIVENVANLMDDNTDVFSNSIGDFEMVELTPVEDDWVKVTDQLTEGDFVVV